MANRPLSALDPESVLPLVRDAKPDLVVIGPEAALVTGVVDALMDEGIPAFGPTARAAEIEGSKVFAKHLMRTYGIPTAAYETYEDPTEAEEEVRKGLYPKVVKADGLAAGKGAIIVRSAEEGAAAVREIASDKFGQAGRRIVIEAFLTGEEMSAFAVARGQEFVLLPFVQDHKQIGEGDTGPNTGGMGAYGPVAPISDELRTRVREDVLAPTLRAMEESGRPFSGVLFAGLMVDDDRPQVLEFNCRFGDPETQVLVPLCGAPLLDAIRWSATGDGNPHEIQQRVDDEVAARGFAGTVVLASHGYPGAYDKGKTIDGLRRAAAMPQVHVFHAGTSKSGEQTVSSGGRVLAVTGVGEDLRSALGRAYEAVSVVEFEGKTFRRDIGHRRLGDR